MRAHGWCAGSSQAETGTFARGMLLFVFFFFLQFRIVRATPAKCSVNVFRNDLKTNYVARGAFVYLTRISESVELGCGSGESKNIFTFLDLYLLENFGAEHKFNERKIFHYLCT